ncbi:C-type lectin BfL-2-like [Ostrea edulis]|uniref:C-type lectin BfL-2-like n=1 Tax=Ostrea edulis TaxID=37623 RepID=UPI0024AFDE53|nr:C-type lectin BfL-2-like [Ostrea edulis]
MRGWTCVFSYIIITLYTQSRAESRILRGFQDANMKNRVFTPKSIRESVQRSKIQCVDSCSTVDSCISLLYNSVVKICRLYDQDFTHEDSFSYEENWDYFYIIRVPDWSITKAECNKQDHFLYVYSLDFCFKVFLKEKTYDEALNECRTFSGGNLVKIDRKLKQTEVEKYLDTMSLYFDSSDQIRIAGYHSHGNEWVYDDNQVLTYFNWNTAQDQPEGQTGIAISLGMTSGYRWHDVSDNRDLKFICEIRAQ